METYNGMVRTPNDAIILFEACRLGLLPRVQRRLSEKERQSIRSGSVFVWDEREAGMRRWTDGKSWSASRVSGSFLTYREMEGKRGGNGIASNLARGGKTPESGRNSAEDGADGEEGPDGYRYKPDGLMKQSFSITTSTGQHLHLISYYSRVQATNPGLQQPSTDPNLRHIRPQKGMYPESTINDQNTVPAVTRSPMIGAPPYTMSPPTFGRPPATHPNSYLPPQYHHPYAYPPSPMGTPPHGYAMHYPPNALPPIVGQIQHQMHYGPPMPGPPLQSHPPPPPPMHAQHYMPRPDQPSLPAFNHGPSNIPPPLTAGYAPAPPQGPVASAPSTVTPSTAPAPAPIPSPVPNHTPAPVPASIPPPAPAPVQAPAPVSAPVVQEGTVPQIDPRLIGAQSNADKAVKPEPALMGDNLESRIQPISAETPIPAASASEVPSIGALVNGAAAAAAAAAAAMAKVDSNEKRDPSAEDRRSGSRSPGGTKKGPKDIPSEKLGFGEDMRALRQLDKVFTA